MARSPKPTASARPVAVLALVAGAVLAGDLFTKSLAVLWAESPRAPSLALGRLLRVTLVYNNHSAFSVSIGSGTWRVNVLLTVLALVLLVPICRDLAVIDRRSTVALGLIGGAGLGNLLSLLTSPLGVVDFLALNTGGGRELVMNFADIAAYAGVLLLLPTGGRLVSALRAQRRVRRAYAALETPAARAARLIEVERPLTVHVERSERADPAARRDPVRPRHPIGDADAPHHPLSGGD
ncbi:MAG TPA: signal peptidase II [Gemmatimonadaceae bacterium]|nr:signal peptidase II [Gemmatimonadaceae bacterium]